VIAGAALAWLIVLIIAGGFDTTILGLRIRSNNPYRVATLLTAALVAFVLAGGSVRGLARSAFGVLRRWTVAAVSRHGWIACAIAAMSALAAANYGTRIAGDSDAYGYVSEADLWRSGRLHQNVPWIDRAPWPQNEWVFSPPGYKPVRSVGGWTIVPTYSPGLPLLMAAAKSIGGQCALFAVVPLMSGLGVLATFGLGRRLGASLAGLIAAGFVATSPAVLSIEMEPLTDVPVMTAWAIALYFLLGEGAAASLAAGLFAALAILIRPNLFILAAIMGAWFFLRRVSDADRPPKYRRLAHAGLFGAGVLPGIIAVAAINQTLYGSATMSGYGSLGEQFAWSRVLPNLGHYLSWYAESQTPVALVGMIVLAVPLRRIWPAVADRSVFAILGGFVAGLWAEYAAYLEFHSWGFLRFLLPSWPLLMVGLSAGLLAIARTQQRTAKLAVTAVVLTIGFWTIRFANRNGVFDQRQAARQEAVLGQLVRTNTEPGSVIITLARAGSLRYYGGRLTARYDYIDAAWLDRFVAWLSAEGVHVYALLDEHEWAEFHSRFAGQQTLSHLGALAIDYRPVATRVFDLAPDAGSKGVTTIVNAVPPAAPGCDPPAAPPRVPR